MVTLEEAVTRSLQCPICLELLTEPKLLSCAHTFCMPCITLLCNSSGDGDAVSCPVCQKNTAVKHEDPSQLPTNLQVKTLVCDVAEARQSCAQCESKGEPPPAQNYCQDCKMYMCAKCQKKHSEWKANASHRVSTVDDIRRGKVVFRKKLMCQEHKAGEGEHECTDVCLTCRKIICMRCRVIDHEKKGHDVKGAAEYTINIKNKIRALQFRAKTRAATFKNHSTFIEEQKNRVTTHFNKRKAEIDEIYQESVRRLTESREKLIEQCETEKEKLLAELDKLKTGDESTVESIESASELVGNSLKAPLEGDIVAIRHALCEKINDVIDRDDSRMRDAAAVTRRAEKFEFEVTPGQNEHDLGRVMQNNVWKLRADLKLSRENSMSAMSATPDGNMAVGSHLGGIEIYTSGGHLQQTALKTVRVKELRFLSDGRLVSIDFKNTISLYTGQFEKLDVRFETLSSDEDGNSDCLAVNSDDHIYVHYRKPKKIQVFTPAGGKPVGEISCDGFVPEQIFIMDSKYRFLVKSAYFVRVIDDHGEVKRGVIKEDAYPFPAVRHDDSVLIAWVKYDEGLVTIDQYSSGLKHVTTLITDYKLEKPKKRNWFYLQEFLSGEIALCTPERLYIFH